MQRDPELEKIVERIEKLLRLAAKNPNAIEAAAATAKAQEMLAAHNLELSSIDRSEVGSSGAREDAKVRGGMYKFQRELWAAVADLNFCFYFTIMTPVMRGEGYWRRHTGGFRYEHRLIGRKVNVAATKVLAQYLEEAIEKLLRTRLGGMENYDHRQLFSNWSVSFRKGAAETVIRKVYDRRQQVLDEEEQRIRDETERAGKGASTARALTLATLKEREEQANYDFMHGDGAWAKKQAQELEREKEWQERRARQAAADAEAEATYTAWAAANPEKAAKEERRREKEEERKRARRRGRWSWGPRDTTDHSAFRAGRDAGEKVSLDPQTADARPRGKIGHERKSAS